MNRKSNTCIVCGCESVHYLDRTVRAIVRTSDYGRTSMCSACFVFTVELDEEPLLYDGRFNESWTGD